MFTCCSVWWSPDRKSRPTQSLSTLPTACAYDVIALCRCNRDWSPPGHMTRVASFPRITPRGRMHKPTNTIHRFLVGVYSFLFCLYDRCCIVFKYYKLFILLWIGRENVTRGIRQDIIRAVWRFFSLSLQVFNILKTESTRVHHNILV